MPIVLSILGIAVGVALLMWWLARRRQGCSLADGPRARRAFERQCASLHREFFRRAAASGRPRGLRWKDCEFDSRLTLARDPQSQLVLAFVGVTISFEAIPGGPMEDVEAVANLRAGTAVFTYARGRWSTDGRVLFNLEPQDAMQRYEGRIEPLEDKTAQAQ